MTHITEHHSNMTTTKSSKVKQTIIFIMIVAIILLGLWWLMSAKKAGSTRAIKTPIPVKVAKVSRENFSVYLNALGTVTAYNTVNVVSRVQGELVKILFKEGQEVKQGELLAVIDPRPYEAAYLQAKGLLQQNKALLHKARTELMRYQTLIKQDSIAKQTYEAQKALVEQYQGAVTSSQAQLNDAQLNLEFTQIKAPISGRLGIRQVDVGNFIQVGASTPLVIITQTQPISVLFTLPAKYLPEVTTELNTGAKLQVEAWNSSHTQLLAVGEVETLDNQINTTTGTILIKARFTNEPEILFPNQFVNIKLKLTTLTDSLVIPTDSVQYGNKGTFVYVVDQDKVHLRYIQLGLADADKTTIASGLKPGESIVLEGVDRLRENSHVEVIKEEPSTQDNTENKPATNVL